jgi:hypothetical protein
MNYLYLTKKVLDKYCSNYKIFIQRFTKLLMTVKVYEQTSVILHKSHTTNIVYP